ncbi:GGDEF domain-containing protein [Hydrogenimonas sp.]
MDRNVVKAASRECKAAIDALEIVTPAIYTSIFTEIAKKYGIETKELADATEKFLDRQIQKLLILNRKSGEHIEQLDETSKKALDAMQAHDESSLQKSIEETEALRREIERLKESVYTDSLTGTHNRKWLDAHLLDTRECFKSPCILAIVDLNYFKQINDTLGHIAGDKVLKLISAHLKTLGVPVIRYGGDEFLLIFDGSTDMEKAAKKMHLCREALLKKSLLFNGRTFKGSFSYGLYSCTQGENFSDALEKADRKMYEDKKEIKKRIAPPFP